MLPLKSDDRLLLIQIILCFFEKKSNKNSLKKEINLGIFFFTKPDRIAKTKTVFFGKKWVKWITIMKKRTTISK
ncbi:MAG: hypothetical protein C0403_12815 [Desulfobacterium sp.]|nr:hypothetical protein [Desulfobacterium sp.]